MCHMQSLLVRFRLACEQNQFIIQVIKFAKLIIYKTPLIIICIKPMHRKQQKKMAFQWHNLFKITFTLLFISTLIQSTTSTPNTTTNSTSTTYKKFLKNQCNSTTYPNVCYKSLFPYTSKIKTNTLTLTKIAIYLALKSSRSASMTLKNLSSKKLTHAETLVIADCSENVDDSVDSLEQSADGLVHLNGTRTNDEKFQWDTIKTWMSSVITNAGTCTDEFDEMEVRSSVQKKIKTSVGNLASLTSNALAFVNRLSY